MPALRRLHEHLSRLPAIGRLLLLVFHPGTAGYQPGYAPFARTVRRQCFGLLALLLLLGRMPGQDRPRRTDLRVAAGDGRKEPDRLAQKVHGQRYGLRHGRSGPFLRGCRSGPHRGIPAPLRTQQQVEPWYAYGRDIPHFARSTFNARWKAGKVKSEKPTER